FASITGCPMNEPVTGCLRPTGGMAVICRGLLAGGNPIFTAAPAPAERAGGEPFPQQSTGNAAYRTGIAQCGRRQLLLVIHAGGATQFAGPRVILLSA